jgi:hypothetical protein
MNCFPLHKSDDSSEPVPAHAQSHPVFSGETYGLMTAESPKFPVKKEGGNQALEDHLNRHNIKYDRISGYYDSPENSYLIHNIPLKQLHQLGQDFGQESVIHGEGGKHEFHYTNGPNQGRFVAHNQNNPVSFFNTKPENYYSSMPGGGFFRLNFDPNWNINPAWGIANKSESNLTYMNIKKIPMFEVGAALYARLKKFEADFMELRKKELAKAGHVEPGTHEAPQPGAPEHNEPGGHEKYDMSMPDTAPQQPVGSSLGVPTGELQAPPQNQPTSMDPNAGMGSTCPVCNQEDVPGSCTCVGANQNPDGHPTGTVPSFGSPNPAANPPQNDLALSEKEPKTQNVATPMNLSESGLCKGCKKLHKTGTACMGKADDYVDNAGKKKTVGTVGKVPFTSEKLGDKMSGDKSKVIASPGSGDDKPKKGVLKAEPPIAKPPSGINPATATSVSKPKAPKVVGAVAPKAPAAAAAKPASPFGKAAASETAKADMTVGKPSKMPHPEVHAERAKTHAAALEGAFTPKKPVVSGLELNPAKGSRAARFGKSELGLCPLLCGKAEHLGSCSK